MADRSSFPRIVVFALIAAAGAITLQSGVSIGEVVDSPGGSPGEAMVSSFPTINTPVVSTPAIKRPAFGFQTATSTATPTPTVLATGTPTHTPTQGAGPSPAVTASTTPGTAGTPTATGTVPVQTVTGSTTPTATASATPSLAKLENDDIASAFPITSFPFTATQNAQQATTASDDPDMGAGAGVNSRTVWFRFTAPRSGGLRANTFGSDYDTVLAAFTGTRGSLSLVSSADDSSGGIQSEIGFNVQSGTVYYLEVAEYPGTSGGGQLHITVDLGDPIAATATATRTPTATQYPTSTPTATAGPAPANDDIGSAAVMSAFPFIVGLDTGGATTAPDDPDMGAGAGVNSHTVWYRFTASTAGSLRANALGSSYDTVVAAFTGARGSLFLVASNDDAYSGTTHSQLSFNVAPGTTYYLEVAEYGTGSGGRLQMVVESSQVQVAGTPAAGTPTAVAPAVLGAPPPSIPPAMLSRQPAVQDARYFALTGYRVNLDPFWDYFQKRGGLRTFGYPISWEMPFLGYPVQFFQRGVMQLMPDGRVTTLNLLDGGLMSYNRVNSSTFPKAARELQDTAPTPADPDYGAKAVAFLEANVPDQWEGLDLGFLRSYLGTVRYQDAFPDGEGNPALLPLLNLEMWGLPTSAPARDPSNHGFVYQRFQRGILMFDDSNGATQGLLLADYLKSIMTGDGLPADLEAQSKGSALYRQYDVTLPGGLVRPGELPGTNLAGAFERNAAR